MVFHLIFGGLNTSICMPYSGLLLAYVTLFINDIVINSLLITLE